MGAWAVDSFGNDNACDWSYDLENAKNISFVDAALTEVINAGSNYIDSSPAEVAIAAAEVVARLQGNYGLRNPYTETMDNWVAKKKAKSTPMIATKAHKAIDRILAGNNELFDVWKESADFEAWKASLHDLKSRISLLQTMPPESKKGFFARLFGG